MQNREVAIVMGDIVKSREHESVAGLHDLFNDAVAEFNRRFAKDIRSPMTVTLGDEFQGIVENLRYAFEIVHQMRLHLLGQGVECRFVAGSGRIDTPVNPERAWNMMGEGLSKTRSRLADKKDTNCYRFSLPDHPALEELLNTVGITMTEIETDWTDTQRKYAIAGLMRGERTVVETAETFGTSERNFYKVLDAGNLKLYRRQQNGIRRALALLEIDG